MVSLFLNFGFGSPYKWEDPLYRGGVTDRRPSGAPSVPLRCPSVARMALFFSLLILALSLRLSVNYYNSIRFNTNETVPYDSIQLKTSQFDPIRHTTIHYN